MPGKPPGEIVLGVLRLIEECGPMTRSGLCRALGKERAAVASVISRMNRAWPCVPKRLYVSGYVYDDDDGVGRRYPRAQYDIGDLPDARKPRKKPKEVSKRYRENNKMQVNSVFMLGQPARGRRSLVKL
jgi:hypothetical protein